MATLEMTVNGLVVQSATSYDLRKNAQTGFRKITVTRDTDGNPAADKASGTFDSNAANLRIGATVWSELSTRIQVFPFKAIIHHTNNVVSDLTFANP